MAQQRGAGRTTPTARSIKSPVKPQLLEPKQTAKHGPPSDPVKVRAIEVGYYNDQRYRIGDVFICERSAMSKRWMEEVHPRTREHSTDAGKALAAQHAALKGGEARRVDDDEDAFGED